MNKVRIVKIMKNIKYQELVNEFLSLRFGKRYLNTDTETIEKEIIKFNNLWNKIISIKPKISDKTIILDNKLLIAVDDDQIDFIKNKMTYVNKHSKKEEFSKIKLPDFTYMDDLSINEILGCKISLLSIHLYGEEKIIATIMNEIFELKINNSIFEWLSFNQLMSQLKAIKNNDYSIFNKKEKTPSDNELKKIQIEELYEKVKINNAIVIHSLYKK